VQLDARLREVHIGQMAGMRKSDARREYPDPEFRGAHPSFDFRSIGGESRTQVLDRIRACCDRIARIHGTAHADVPFVVIVSHGTALRVLLEHLGIRTFHEQGSYQVVTYPPDHS
jgi:probable phosphoglycerate mutase